VNSATLTTTAAATAANSEDHHPKHSYQEIDFEGVMAVLKDPNTASGLNVIVDARKDDLFDEGHIPGAILCNPHEMDLYLDTLRPAVSGADKVIVYCGGGTCEASHNVSDALRAEFGFSDVSIYTKGWEEVEASGRFKDFIVKGENP